MKRVVNQAGLALAFSFALVSVGCSSSSSGPSSSVSSSSANGSYAVCYTSSNGHGVTVSSAFRLPQADSVTMLEEPWAKDFRTYVAQSGDEGGVSVTCVPADPKNPDAALKDKIDEWQKQGITVKHVNWKYAGG